MFSLASKAAAGLLVSADVPAKYQWATKCDYEGQDWDKFQHFATLFPHIKSRDQCMGISSYMFTIADVNHNFNLERCEHMYACLASMYKKGQSDAQDHKNGMACAKAITKERKAGTKVSLKTMGQICAHAYPTLEGSPLHHE